LVGGCWALSYPCGLVSLAAWARPLPLACSSSPSCRGRR